MGRCTVVKSPHREKIVESRKVHTAMALVIWLYDFFKGVRNFKFKISKKKIKFEIEIEIEIKIEIEN
jgi:hypothetical protein